MARFIIWHFMHRRGMTSHAIGREFDRHHSDVIYGLKRLKERIPIDKQLRTSFEAIKEQTNGTWH
jgi:chromosomal replication initiation ATPase DnaA